MSYFFSWKTQIFLFIISIILALLLQNQLIEVAINFIMHIPVLYDYAILQVDLYTILLMILITFVHEPLHGIFYILFGGKVKYGLKMGCAYTQEITGIAINKYKFIVILLMPLTVISIVSLLLLPDWIGNMIFWLNLFGSVGDIYMTVIIMFNRKGNKVIDRNYGFDII